ncbi:MAG: hypothetical protein GXO79_11515 [Chlorobi bacterium]|nr:hypothetical protein [Chlorobiota bacterium]
MKKIKILSISMILLLILVGFSIAKVTSSISLFHTKEISNNFPSQCYTDLHPSEFLTSKIPSQIITNDDKNYIKINIKNRKFFIGEVTSTGSMRPTLGRDSSVILIKPEIQDIKVGDIITFYCDGTHIVHRVIKIENETYTTKGDNNNVQDDCQTKFKDIDGMMVGVIY